MNRWCGAAAHTGHGREYRPGVATGSRPVLDLRASGRVFDFGLDAEAFSDVRLVPLQPVSRQRCEPPTQENC